MARRKDKKKGRRKQGISLLSLVPVAVVGSQTIAGFTANGLRGALDNTVLYTTGVDINTGEFKIEYVAPFAASLVGAYAAKKLVAMAGVNRSMAGLPFRL